MYSQENIRVILGSLKYKSSPNVDFGIKIPFQQKFMEMIDFNRNYNIDLAQLFDDERQKSYTFRPTTKITFLFKNSYSGETNYSPFKNNLYYLNELFYRQNQLNNPNVNNYWGGFPSYNEFDFIRTDYNVSGYTQPPNEHLIFNSKSSTTYNWNYYISYPYTSDTNTILMYYGFPNTSPFSWKVSDGIPFEYKNITINGKNLISFQCGFKHGISVGEYIQTSIKFNGQDTFQVYSLGNGIYGTEEYYVNIYDIGYLTGTLPNTNNGTLKRIINIQNSAETISSYYVRRHKILTNPEDAILVKTGFEYNNFENQKKFYSSAVTPDYQVKIVTKENNQSYSLSFSRDINIESLLDNNKRPVSELFITIIHHGYFGWFYPGTIIKRGWEFNLEESNSTNNNYWRNFNNNNFSNDLIVNSYLKSGLNFNYIKPLISGDTLDGDVCEWNNFEQTERVISNLYYKIIFNRNHFNINTNSTNPEGYYYSPHVSLKIRDFSSYIEEGQIGKVSEVPDYAFYSKYRGVFRWRDIYTYGFIDETGVGVDYPFINGVHYPYVNSIFRVIPEGTNTINSTFFRTQDPINDDCE